LVSKHLTDHFFETFLLQIIVVLDQLKIIHLVSLQNIIHTTSNFFAKISLVEKQLLFCYCFVLLLFYITSLFVFQ